MDEEGLWAAGLKEWAVAADALARGDQILIMRKGGIREETKEFRVESDSFYLYPTYEHQRKELVKPPYADRVEELVSGWSAEQIEIGIELYAELAEDILIHSQEQLDKLAPFHIWTDRFAEERLKWKRAKPLHLMLLRVYKLETPVRIPVLPAYNGCKSWIELPGKALDAVERRQVLSEEQFQVKQAEIKAALNR
ncbi:hypothetical protein SAMN02799630_02586 [Paenibacillus sp. UNCCL117]|uniref:DUF1802 family protein n=1 Tax=unclassified Paenibacillus TaxID=185978 RepID=UPI000886C3D1|nr:MULTISPECIES: DUF1802 family protein [unclassified Paenibacillus]SDC06876.1 hypothetical protein SAMN04488602_101255 [Paenibacillus sp. cl123]SFW37918.1 hypothetical protein SAMN02799630_02586 [Paenibacillus sp. UNCCL117]